MHPADMIIFRARSNPEQPALVQPDRVVTYWELAEAIESIAERIQNYGFESNRPVAVSIHHPIQTLAVCFALLRCGISACPIHPAALPHLRSNGIDDIIFSGIGPVLSGGRHIRFEDSWLKRERQVSSLKASAQASAAARASMIFLTPNAAGKPGKLITSSGALMARVAALPLVSETEYESTLVTASLRSPLGFGQVAVHLHAGKTVGLAHSLDGQTLLIDAFNIEALACSARDALDIASQVRAKKHRFLSLKEIWLDGGIVSKEAIVLIQTHLCGNLVRSYSSSEAGYISFANCDALAAVPGAAGFIAPDAIVEIVDDEDVRVPIGLEGRVRCRTEYYREIFTANNPTHAGVAEIPWHYTGDYGRLTGDGLLCLSRTGKTSAPRGSSPWRPA